MENALNIADRFDPLPAEALLAIPVDEPERLFAPDAADTKAAYRFLIKKWHPDRSANPLAREVLERVMAVYEAAMRRLAQGTWAGPNAVLFEAKDGTKSKLRYVKRDAFEYGDVYIARSHVVYVMKKENAAACDRALAAIRALPFVDDRMRKAFASALPQVARSFETKAQERVLVLKKEPGSIRLADLLRHEKGRLDPRHAAWILSTLHNLSCYLAQAGVTHNAISAQNYFIGPKSHAGALLGGWWFALREGEAIDALPEAAFDVAPPDVLREGRADPRLDLEMLRAVGREMLGDPRGVALHKDPRVPKAFASWLRLPSSGDAVADYRAWQERVITDSFGGRRYAEMKVSFDDVYGRKGGAAAGHPHP